MSLQSHSLDRTNRHIGRRALVLRRIVSSSTLGLLTRVRDSEPALIGIAAGVGLGVGAIVASMTWMVAGLHFILFGIPMTGHLSDAGGTLNPLYFVLPAFGGALIGLTANLLRYLRPRDTVDAIEANALYGGRMSLRDSLGLAWLTILSVGFGGSAGLEAAYTQVGSGLASKIGQNIRLRRQDLRLLVGCGAAAAIAAAFDSPLSGAFYAFELVIGSYSLQSLAPVASAALCGSLTMRGVLGSHPLFEMPTEMALESHDYGIFLLLGLGAAAISVATMRAVTVVERVLRQRRVPTWARPVIGGAAVGAVAFVYPEVLGSGHGAITSHLTGRFDLGLLACVLAAKIVASAFTVGSGMRGGLFSSSLFLGAVYGSAVSGAVAAVAPAAFVNPQAYALVGMAAVAAGVVGAPVTMILLVLETTGNFSLTVAVMAGVIACVVAVRQTFGYSFATWRFHTRGLRLRGAFDIGWISELSVGKLMRKDFHIVPASETVAELRKHFPVGGPKYAFVADEGGAYIGMIETLEAHSSRYDDDADSTRADMLIHTEAAVLTPQENIHNALVLFTKSAMEVLPVVDTRRSGRIVGSISEAYALRRYSQELEKQRVEETNGGVFSPEGR